MKVVIKLPAIPTRPPPKPKAGARGPRRPSKMNWNCTQCKSMMCLDKEFNLKQSRKDKSLPEGCPLNDPYFQSNTARILLMDTNESIMDVRIKMRELEVAIKNMRIKEAGLVVQRHKQLGSYFEKVTLTKVTEKRSKKGKVTVDTLPTFKVTVSEIRYGDGRVEKPNT